MGLGARHLIIFLLMMTNGINQVLEAKFQMLYARSKLSSLHSAPTTNNAMLVKISNYSESTLIYMYVLSMIFTIILNFCTGVLTLKVGNKLIILFETILCAITSLITPYFTVTLPIEGDYFIACLRGIANGMMLPPIYSMVSKWLPPTEHCSGIAIVIICGQGIGEAILFSLEKLETHIGYEKTLYFNGVIGCIWSVFWYIFSAETPDTCIFISEKECVYIFKSLKYYRPIKSKEPIPWIPILRCRGLIALAIILISKEWTRIVFISRAFVSAYLYIVINEKPDDINFKARIIFLPAIFIAPALGYFVDKTQILIKWPKNNYRKFFTATGYYGATISLAFLIYLHGTGSLTALGFFIYFSLFGDVAGFMTAFLNLSGTYAGLLVGLALIPCNITLIFKRHAANYFIKNIDDVNGYHDFFKSILLCIYICTLLFIIIGKFEKQDFDEYGAIIWKRASVESYPPVKLER